MPFPGSKIFHPKWVSSIPNHFPVIITISKRIASLGSFGEEVVTYSSDPPIRAHIEPFVGSEEIRRPDQTIVREVWTIALQGYYPHIALLSQIATSDSRVFEVLGVASDDFERITYLTAEAINRREASEGG